MPARELRDPESVGETEKPKEPRGGVADSRLRVSYKFRRARVMKIRLVLTLVQVCWCCKQFITCTVNPLNVGQTHAETVRDSRDSHTRKACVIHA